MTLSDTLEGYRMYRYALGTVAAIVRLQQARRTSYDLRGEYGIVSFLVTCKSVSILSMVALLSVLTFNL